ncbi:CDP-diacylglycerol---serine O-phosphatidyltransferase [Thermophagus xiamenensis]|jgi:CDP-diacylglycerol--serine O-phosphatidyltransferase|uniref:CDP-diacylglycerol---serine O-phosphatidyltransferase n=2 Tax=Thermophagus xiamenensis TaxID=385682 RepID=A0A1I1UF01_9BACT|nr:CDP-diacylglycerol---serine O-phosphatidyltransferase [Thermophagus xiamenensis]
MFQKDRFCKIDNQLKKVTFVACKNSLFDMNLLKHFPNTLTSLNLLLGTIGMFLALQGQPDLTAWCVLLAAVFDFSDGFAARMLNAYSDIGKELDSLADLVSFGLAPAAAYMSLLHYGMTQDWNINFWQLTSSDRILLLIPFLLTVFSALRLAKFNIDTRQTETFLGLTTTATGMFSVSLVHFIFTNGGLWPKLASPYVVLGLIAVFCLLLVSEIPMFSLKFKSFCVKGNELRYLLLLIGLLSVLFIGIGGIAVTVLLYVLFSIGKLLFSKRKEGV